MKVNQFSLVELIVVIAIFALLAALIQPSLKKAIAAADIITCLSNERGISAANFLYSEDNDNYIVPSGFYNQQTRTLEVPPWDVSLAAYMGRTNLTRTYQGINPQNDILRCPSDTVAGGAGWERRGYVMNGRSTLQPNHEKWGPASGMPHYRISDIPAASSTFLFTEWPEYWNLISYWSRTTVANTRGQSSVQKDLHGAFQYNYLFVDGHAETLHQQETATRYPDWWNLGAWSIDPND